MAAEEATSWRTRLDTAAVDLRNEAIVQTANVYLCGRRVTVVGMGSIALGLDQVQKLLQQAVVRGEQVEYDTQQAVERLRSQATGNVETAKRAAGSRLTASVSTGLASLLNLLPGVNMQYAPPQREEVAASDKRTKGA